MPRLKDVVLKFDGAGTGATVTQVFSNLNVDNLTIGDGGEEDFIHSPMFVLVDKEKRLRGYYDGKDSTDVDRLIDDIRILIGEYQLTLK